MFYILWIVTIFTIQSCITIFLNSSVNSGVPGASHRKIKHHSPGNKISYYERQSQI